MHGPQVTLPILDTRSTRPREACGLFGIHAPGADVAHVTFVGLQSLQHRGQESAGIAVSNGRTAGSHLGMGLVTEVFGEAELRPLIGHLAIGHTRYSTTGSSSLRNAQPHMIDGPHGPLGVAHNGNLTFAPTLRQRLINRGIPLASTSDSEIIARMLASPEGGNGTAPNWEDRIADFMSEAEGAYALVILTRDAVVGARDPLGLRPLCVGEFRGENGMTGHVLASESCALASVGARYLREVRPGEIVRLDRNGLHSAQGCQAATPSALCVFEYVYFARADSLLEDQAIHEVRRRLGARLWEEAPVQADLIMGVPASGTSAAEGYSVASGIPPADGLIQCRSPGRTFIEPNEHLRRNGVKNKFNPLMRGVAGKRIVVVDDSLVRGNTVGPLVRLLREGEAAEVHVRVCSPPVRHPCYMGVDMGTHDQLIAHRLSMAEILREVGADSLAYLSLEGMIRAINAGLDRPTGHCTACFSGVYPLKVEAAWTANGSDKLAFEREPVP